MATEMKRTRRLNIRLSDDVVNRLESQAEKRGIAVSTLASYAIGEYLVEIEKKDKAIDEFRIGFTTQLNQKLESMIDGFMSETSEEQLDLMLKNMDS